MTQVVSSSPSRIWKTARKRPVFTRRMSLSGRALLAGTAIGRSPSIFGSIGSHNFFGKLAPAAGVGKRVAPAEPPGNKMHPPLVSIAMPFRNNERTLAEAIRSIQLQTFQDWELLLCDDGSSDESVR